MFNIKWPLPMLRNDDMYYDNVVNTLSHRMSHDICVSPATPCVFHGCRDTPYFNTGKWISHLIAIFIGS